MTRHGLHRQPRAPASPGARHAELSHSSPHGGIVFLFGVMFGVAAIITLLLYLDRTNTDVGLMNKPSQIATCYSFERIGMQIWLCTRRRHDDWPPP